jgi:hypothetical protein
MNLKEMESFFSKKGELAALKLQLYDIGHMIIDERQDKEAILIKLKSAIKHLEEIENL